MTRPSVDPRSRESGVYLVAAAIGVFALFALGAVLVDLRLASSAQLRLQIEADAAALGGTASLAQGPTTNEHRLAALAGFDGATAATVLAEDLPIASRTVQVVNTLELGDPSLRVGGEIELVDALPARPAANLVNDESGDIRTVQVTGATEITSPVETSNGTTVELRLAGNDVVPLPDVRSSFPKSPALFTRGTTIFPNAEEGDGANVRTEGYAVRAESTSVLDTALQVQVLDGERLRADIAISLANWSPLVAGDPVLLSATTSIEVVTVLRVGDSLTITGDAPAPAVLALLPEVFVVPIIETTRVVGFVAIDRTGGTARAATTSLPLAIAPRTRVSALDPAAVAALGSDPALRSAWESVRSNPTAPRVVAARLGR